MPLFSPSGGGASAAAILAVIAPAPIVATGVTGSRTLAFTSAALETKHDVTMTGATVFTIDASAATPGAVLTVTFRGPFKWSFANALRASANQLPVPQCTATKIDKLQIIVEADGSLSIAPALLGADVPTLTVTTLSSLVASAATTVTVAYAGPSPTNLDYSFDSGSFATLDVSANAVSISNGTATFSVANPGTAGAHTLQVRSTGTQLVSPQKAITLTPAAAPSAPSSVAATPTATDSAVSLALTATANGAAVTSFNIRRGTTAGGEASTPIGTATPSSSPSTGVTTAGYVDSTAVNGTAYFYTAEAVSTAGNTTSAEVTAAPAAGSWIPPAIAATATMSWDYTDPASARDSGVAAGGAASGLIDRVTSTLDNTKFIGQVTPAAMPAIVTTGGVDGARRVGRYTAGTSFLSSVAATGGSGANTTSLLDQSNPSTAGRYICFAARFAQTGVVSRPLTASTQNTPGTGLSVRQTTTTVGFSQQSTGGGSVAIDRSPAAMDTSWHIFECCISQTGAETFWIDGVQVGSGTFTDTTGITNTAFFHGGGYTANTTTQVGNFGGDHGLGLINPLIPASGDRATLRANMAAKMGGISTV